MRSPSLLLPAGAVTAAVGINLPVITMGVHLRSATVLDGDFGASSTQRAYVLGLAVLAIAAWALSLLGPRLKGVAFGIALAATAGVAVAAVRGWLIATDGPHALQTGDSSFLERSALSLLERLENAGILSVEPASGLWVLSAGVAAMLIGGLLALRAER